MATKRTSPLARPPDRRGTPASGRIMKLLVGQGHGYIRLSDGREIFFHRADVDESCRFNEFQVGNAVVFELLDDRVSGARAVRVRRSPPR